MISVRIDHIEINDLEVIATKYNATLGGGVTCWRLVKSYFWYINDYIRINVPIDSVTASQHIPMPNRCSVFCILPAKGRSLPPVKIYLFPALQPPSPPHQLKAPHHGFTEICYPSSFHDLPHCLFMDISPTYFCSGCQYSYYIFTPLAPFKHVLRKWMQVDVRCTSTAYPWVSRHGFIRVHQISWPPADDE